MFVHVMTDDTVSQLLVSQFNVTWRTERARLNKQRFG